jgi:hypothetical protein
VLPYLKFQPYRGFDSPNKKHDYGANYVFVPIPRDEDEDEDTDEDTDEDENADRDGSEQLDVPILKHRAHPFYIIHNALPRLREHNLLDPKQRHNGICLHLC